MEATILTDSNTKITITLTPEQIALVEQSTKDSKHFTPTYYRDCFAITSNGNVQESNINYAIVKEQLLFGTVRTTRELAEISSINQRQRNKLEEIVHHLAPNYRFNADKMNSSIAYDKSLKIFQVGYDKYFCIGTVYMPLETATEIVTALNNGELPELYKLLTN